jgi:hypothetical protein
MGGDETPRRIDSEIMRTRVKLLTILAAAIVLSGCGTDNFRDVKGVESQDPDYIAVYNNVDKHPNIAWVCIEGVAFATTTRQYDSITRVPEWDHECTLRATAP